MLLDAELTSESKLIELVKAQYQRKKTETREWRERIDTRRNDYYLDQYPEPPEEGQEQIYLAHAMRLVDTAQNLLMMEPPRIRAYRQTETGQSLEQGDELEAWLRGLLHLQVLRGRLDPVEMFVRDMLTTGMGVLSVYWDISLPMDQCPIVFQRRDPKNIFAQEGSTVGRWRWVIHAQQLPVLDIESEWRDPETRQPIRLKNHVGRSYGEKIKDTAEVLDVWSREIDEETGEAMIVNAVICEDQILKAPMVMERYNCLPFEIAFCIATPSEDWLRKGLPITAAIEKQIPELQGVRNANVRAVKLFSQLPLVHKGRGKLRQILAGFGEVLDISPEEDLGFVKWPGSPPDVYAIDRMLEGEISAGGLGQPVMGTPPASASGYSIELRGEAGTLKMVSPARSFQIALANCLQSACQLMAAYAPNDPITVFTEYQNQRKAYSLTGMDCKGWFIDVEVAARFPEDKARDQAMGIQLANSPQRILDQRSIIEDFLHYENVEQIRERLLVEMAEQHPLVTQYMMMKALDDRGLLDLIQVMQGQQPGQAPAGQPSPPGISVPGVATQTAPQESLGAQRSQELGIGPKGRMFPEQQMEEMLGGPASPVM